MRSERISSMKEKRNVDLLIQKKSKKLYLQEVFLKLLLILSSIVSIVLFCLITYFFIKNGLSKFRLSFFIAPVGVLGEVNGIRDYLLNTIFLLLITLPLSTVVAVCGAIYFCEYVKEGKIISLFELSIKILSGIPSIVFGLFGMVFFGEVLHLGYSLLNGALTLTIMVLPILVENTKESLKAIPIEYKLGAFGLGAKKWQVIKTILLPRTIEGIKTGLVLSTGKILGEAAGLLFTAGSKASLSVGLYRMFGKGKIKESFTIGLLLLFFMLVLNFLFQYIEQYIKK